MTQDLISKIKETFEVPEVDTDQYSPLVLAYIGDNVYELFNRTTAVFGADMQVNKLHKECSTRAKAETQSRMIGVLEEKLTAEELSVYKRGRNATSYTKAKNASTTDYRRATGLEALVGWLYMKERYDRLCELMKEGWDALELQAVNVNGKDTNGKKV